MKYSKHIAVTVALFLWVCFFITGVVMSSYGFFTQVTSNPNPLNFLGFVISWTWSNVLFLCVLSSLLGEMASPEEGSYMAAVTRGFITYLVIASGQLIITGSMPLPSANPVPVVNVTPELYFRVACFASLICFMMGFRPDLFATMLNRLPVGGKA